MNETQTTVAHDEVVIDLGKMIGHYFKHWTAFLVSGTVTAFLVLLVSFFLITPMYQASVTIYVNNSMGQNNVTEVSSQGLATSQRLVSTYVNILKSNTVLSEVIKKGNLDTSVRDIRENMSAKQIETTEMFVVTVLNENAEQAALIANTIAEIAPLKISEFVEGSSTKIVDYAAVPQTIYSPSYLKNTVMGGVAGLFLMGILLTLQYLFDMRLKDEDDINSYFAAPVLGSIPEIEDNAGKAGEGK